MNKLSTTSDLSREQQEYLASVVIQCCLRRHRSRRRVKLLREQRKTNIEQNARVERQLVSADILQRFFRNLETRRLSELHRALLEAQLEREEEMEEAIHGIVDMCALSVQSLFRGHRARKRVRQLRRIIAEATETLDEKDVLINGIISPDMEKEEREELQQRAMVCLMEEAERRVLTACDNAVQTAQELYALVKAESVRRSWIELHERHRVLSQSMSETRQVLFLEEYATRTLLLHNSATFVEHTHLTDGGGLAPANLSTTLPPELVAKHHTETNAKLLLSRVLCGFSTRSMLGHRRHEDAKRYARIAATNTDVPFGAHPMSGSTSSRSRSLRGNDRSALGQLFLMTPTPAEDSTFPSLHVLRLVYDKLPPTALPELSRSLASSQRPSPRSKSLNEPAMVIAPEEEAEFTKAALKIQRQARDTILNKDKTATTAAAAPTSDRDDAARKIQSMGRSFLARRYRSTKALCSDEAVCRDAVALDEEYDRATLMESAAAAQQQQQQSEGEPAMVIAPEEEAEFTKAALKIQRQARDTVLGRGVKFAGAEASNTGVSGSEGRALVLSESSVRDVLVSVEQRDRGNLKDEEREARSAAKARRNNAVHCARTLIARVVRGFWCRFAVVYPEYRRRELELLNENMVAVAPTPPTMPRPLSANITSGGVGLSRHHTAARMFSRLVAEEAAVRTQIEHDYAVSIVIISDQMDTEEPIGFVDDDELVILDENRDRLNLLSLERLHSLDAFRVVLTLWEGVQREALATVERGTFFSHCEEFELTRLRSVEMRLSSHMSAADEEVSTPSTTVEAMHHHRPCPPQPRPPSTTPEESLRRLRSTMHRRWGSEQQLQQNNNSSNEIVRRERILGLVDVQPPQLYEDEITYRERLGREVIVETEATTGTTVSAELLRQAMWMLASTAMRPPGGYITDHMGQCLVNFFSEWLVATRTSIDDKKANNMSIMEFASPHLQLVCAGMNMPPPDYARVLHYVLEELIAAHSFRTEDPRRRQISNLFRKWDRHNSGCVLPQEFHLVVGPLLCTVSLATRRLMEYWWLDMEEHLTSSPRSSASSAPGRGLSLRQFHELLDIFTRNHDDVMFRDRVFMIRDTLESMFMGSAENGNSNNNSGSRTQLRKSISLSYQHALDSLSPNHLIDLVANTTALMSSSSVAANDCTFFIRPVTMLMGMYVDDADPWTCFCDHVTLDPTGVLHDLLAHSWYSITEELYLKVSVAMQSGHGIYDPRRAAALDRTLSLLAEWALQSMRLSNVEHDWSSEGQQRLSSPEESARRRNLLLTRLARGRIVSGAASPPPGARELAHALRHTMPPRPPSAGGRGSSGTVTPYGGSSNALYGNRSGSPSFGSGKYGSCSTTMPDTVAPSSPPPRSASPWVHFTADGNAVRNVYSSFDD